AAGREAARAVIGVSTRDGGAADMNAPSSPRSGMGIVRQRNRHSRQRPSDGAVIMNVLRVVERDATRFGCAVKRVDLHAKAIVKRSHGGCSERRAGGNEAPQFDWPPVGRWMGDEVFEHE